MMKDVSADILTEKTHLLIQPRTTVGLSQWLLCNYAQAYRSGRVFAVVTRANSVLTLAAARFITSTGSCWIVDHPDGAFDGFSGLRASWDGVSFKLGGGIHPAYFEVAVGDERALSINAEILHGYHDNPQLGPFSLQILAAAGCAPPVRFGAIEPLYEVFSPTIVTEHARSFSPEEAIAIVSGGDGDGLIISIPEAIGVTERLEFSGPCPRDLTQASIDHFLYHALSTGATYALLGYRQGPQGRMVTPRYRHEVMPLALAVPETAMLHTTLENILSEVRRLGADEASIIDSRPRGIGIRFFHENTTISDLTSRYHSVLRAILPPKEIQDIKPWYQRDDD